MQFKHKLSQGKLKQGGVMTNYFDEAKKIVRAHEVRRQARKLAQDLKAGKKVIAMGRVWDIEDDEEGDRVYRPAPEEYAWPHRGNMGGL